LSYSKDIEKNKAGNLLARKSRIKTPGEFKLVYSSKQWGGSEFFTFNVLANASSEQSGPRLGVTVSKKVAKQAVRRNRIKRQIKEFYRHRSELLLDCDLIISAKPSCAKANDKERQKSLEQLWLKIMKWQRWHMTNNATNA